MITAVVGLLKSRAFLLAVLDLVQILVLNYFHVPEDIWQSIHVVLLVVIGKMGVEDAAEKFGSYGKAGVVASKPEGEEPVAAEAFNK